MDSLMAALVAAVLIRATDRSADAVASVAERSLRTALVASLTGLAVTQTLAAVGGSLVAAHLNPNAARLLFAFALLMAGGGALLPGKPIAPPARGFVALTAHLVATGIGDRTMFATFAVAAGGVPVLAGAGGTLGGLAVLTGAALAGETLWRQRPRQPIALAAGIALLAVGAWLALSALRLI